MGAAMAKTEKLSAASIESMYAARAAAARMSAQDGDVPHLRDPHDENTVDVDKEEITEVEEVDANTSPSASEDNGPKHERKDISTTSMTTADMVEALRNAKHSSTPPKIAVAGVHLRNAILAFGRTARQAFDKAIEALRRIGVIDVAKAASQWIKAHPWETAAIVVPLTLLACTPAFLSLVGFTASGIAAGSIAAGVQAGIGSVAAGSTFAIFTSAAMGGYGVPIVFGGIWAISTGVMCGIAAWFGGGGSGGETRDTAKLLLKADLCFWKKQQRLKRRTQALTMSSTASVSYDKPRMRRAYNPVVVTRSFLEKWQSKLDKSNRPSVE
ncbi:hypothetical protein BDW02DRAFT_652255 [Decorospora gaudefroyi]|uniref:Uncharacterized protein n=1 Tax=Decorospora gaudefroyi TaxID=184978 RepID=A0A6A5JV40_9PLEO|nr:hypothetical protein BDW02DRAFT_652255 [Decorospora gaudefroyi]